MHTTGLLLIVLGGMMEGLFALPMKFTPKWSWENIWGAGSLVALVLVPWPLALVTVPHLGDLYSSVPFHTILLALLFGAGWGFGGLFFGLGVSSVGLALGTSLIMGLIAIGGSVVTLILLHKDQFSSRAGEILIIGIATMVIGLVVCARAGSLKSGKVGAEKGKSSLSGYGIGLVYCLAAGFLSALVNFALIFGAPIAKPAIVRGLDPGTANNAVWALVFTSGYLVNALYCVLKSLRERTFRNFFARPAPRYWGWALIMGILWAGGIVVYGRGASLEGTLGPVFGFPIMLIISILTGNAAGALSGEWRNAPAVAKSTMALGVSVMVLAIVILGYADYVIP
jgi:L-rhamnose-H+ transport protein